MPAYLEPSDPLYQCHDLVHR